MMPSVLPVKRRRGILGQDGSEGSLISWRTVMALRISVLRTIDNTDDDTVNAIPTATCWCYIFPESPINLVR